MMQKVVFKIIFCVYIATSSISCSFKKDNLDYCDQKTHVMRHNVVTTQSDKCGIFENIISDVESIKPGMKASDLSVKFREFSAFHHPVKGTYCYSLIQCPYIRIDVIFHGKQGAEWQSRPNPDWIIESITKPYIEHLPKD